MKLELFTTALALATTVCASPVRCLNQRQANTIVDRFAGILNKQGSDLGDAAKTAQKLIASNYKGLSDSILMVQDKPLGGTTFATKADYVASVLNAPGIEDISTIDVLVAGCNKVIWAWQFNGIGSGEYPVNGFNLFTLNTKNQITKTQTEFNSLAWEKNTEGLSGGPPAAPSSSAVPTAPESTEPETVPETTIETAPETELEAAPEAAPEG